MCYDADVFNPLTFTEESKIMEINVICGSFTESFVTAKPWKGVKMNLCIISLLLSRGRGKEITV